METTPNSLYNNVQVLHSLACQIAREVSDPAQFLDGNRRSQLFNHGLSKLRATNIKSNSIETITENIGRTLQETTQDSVYFAISEIAPAVAVVFPFTSKIHYFSRGSSIEIGGETAREFWITPTTLNERHNDPYVGYPSEGYQDHTGVLAPFADRDTNSRIQHGGLLLNNITGKLEVVDYPRLLETRNGHLEEGQIIIESNWYMDSVNQQLVANRKNLLSPNSYNCIGILSSRKGNNPDLYFTVNPDCTSAEKLSKRVHLPEYHYRDMSMVEIAAICNILAQKFEANRWVVAGLEFHGGGTFFPSNLRSRIFAHRDYFKLEI